MESYDRDYPSADGIVDELMPADLDWSDQVRRYPLAALGIAAVGGYILGRTRGEDILRALSDFAAESVSGLVNDLIGKDVL